MMPPAYLPSKQIDFLQTDYELKIKYLADQFTRMWTRFHFFLVLESGLSAALWVWFKDRGVFAREGLMIAGIGAVSSCIWYIFGAQDRYLVEVYRRQVRDAGRDIAHKLGIPIPPDPDGELANQITCTWVTRTRRFLMTTSISVSINGDGIRSAQPNLPRCSRSRSSHTGASCL